MEAAQVARDAAADIGESDSLKLHVIVDGMPLAGFSIFQQYGVSGNQWPTNAINASDYFGIDVYRKWEGTDPGNALVTINVIKEWLKYSGNKKTYLVENGFTTIGENYPEAVSPIKYSGTEAEQELYLIDLFDLMETELLTGDFKDKLLGFSYWMYTDNPNRNPGEYAYYFGIKRENGAEKPAFSIFKSTMDQWKSDQVLSPVILDRKWTVTKTVDGDPGLWMSYNSATDHQSFICSGNIPSGTTSAVLNVETDSNCWVVVERNGKGAITDVLSSGAMSRFVDISSILTPGETNTFSVWVTSNYYPFTVKVDRVTLDIN